MVSPELDYTVTDKIVGMKSVAAYRSGLEIDPCVSQIEAEEGLLQELNGIYHGVIQIMLDILLNKKKKTAHKYWK